MWGGMRRGARGSRRNQDGKSMGSRKTKGSEAGFPRWQEVVKIEQERSGNHQEKGWNHQERGENH